MNYTTGNTLIDALAFILIVVVLIVLIVYVIRMLR